MQTRWRRRWMKVSIVNGTGYLFRAFEPGADGLGVSVPDGNVRLATAHRGSTELAAACHGKSAPIDRGANNIHIMLGSLCVTQPIRYVRLRRRSERLRARQAGPGDPDVLRAAAATNASSVPVSHRNDHQGETRRRGQRLPLGEPFR